MGHLSPQAITLTVPLCALMKRATAAAFRKQPATTTANALLRQHSAGRTVGGRQDEFAPGWNRRETRRRERHWLSAFPGEQCSFFPRVKRCRLVSHAVRIDDPAAPAHDIHTGAKRQHIYHDDDV
ncbi:hypothetical protein ACEF06_18005 [Brevibacillus agri]|uniref:hypothetical protein n=2 Tax=Brevibacillus agri TaxID=51101 RepID=UPI003D1E2EB6